MTIEEKFNKLVAMLQQDMGKMNARIAMLERQLQQPRQGPGHAGPIPPKVHSMGDGEELVGVHPVTGKGLKASEVDPRLALRMRFSEED